MMRKKFPYFILSALLVLTLILGGCKKDGTSAKAQEYFGWGGDHYKSVETRYALNYDEMFYDNFKEGLDTKESWDLADNVWDQYSTHQNGVRPQNVFLLDDPENPDTHLMIRANGDYYRGSQVEGLPDSMPLSGGVISTKRAFGPGRFEVRMKIAPRTGALTSMWLFAWLDETGGVYQSEVDIEMGLRPHFDKAYFTTWTSPANNSNFAIDVAPKNDGQFHTYTFDWSVDPKKVDYYIDGEHFKTIESNVPNLNATLSLGIWCPTFAGTNTSPSPETGGGREYEYDFAEFDYVRIIPFEQRGWRQRTVKNRDSDNNYKLPKLTKKPLPNKLANADFEHTYSQLNIYNAVYTPKPWTFEGDGLAEITVESDGNKAAKTPAGGWMRQHIQGSFSGYKYRLSGRYRTEGTGTAFIRTSGHKDVYMTNITTSSFNSYERFTQSDGWKNFSYEFTVTDDQTKTLLVWLGNSSDDGSGISYFDDLSLVFLEKE